MSVIYDPVHWTPSKKRYDRVMLALMAAYLGLFAMGQWWLHPQATAETLVIRAAGTLALLMLHVILAIGPLCRLDRRFLPLLYNRRHLGVAMFLTGAVHGVFSLIQFHALGNVSILESLFLSNTRYDALMGFPFQSLGFFALLILFLMAATSHDFWLKNLTPRVWKSLHMGVYAAYALLVMHVMLGVIQLEKSPVLIGLVGAGMFTIIGLHLAAARKQAGVDRVAEVNFVRPGAPINPAPEGFEYACEVDDILDNRAKMLIISGENIALFRYDNKLSAVHNLCKHQNGPLAEGRVLDGCITCPWHGYQYRPEDGRSPAPFTEKLHTYDVWVSGSRVFVNPRPYPEGTSRQPAVIGPLSALPTRQAPD